MFAKILIANRGEIACRIMRTARRLGIPTVAVYSEADEGARHVREADAAVLIGPPPAAKSYLDIDRIVAAAKATGADAVHPGFGFLSENARFAEALIAAGIAFIGPPPAAIAAMGDKIAAKRLAEAAKVSTIPGHTAPVTSAKAAVGIAKDVGYPVMIKAAAGGGGRGMRVVHQPADLAEAYTAARNEARGSFGDDRVFIEKFIEQPRHIEIQVLADAHGNVIHLGERECSIQRRHQKVIEEAPSPLLDAKTRAAMGAQAVTLARAVGYTSAGTVEFVTDPKKNFYFLEMNTRLQVEHTVTELVTGLDLVEWMIRIAAGEKLPIQQRDVRLQGWAIEARVYAEDPQRGFVPSIGRLVRYREPIAEGIRIDSGVEEGDEISVNYDPMIAKLCAHGPDRGVAIERMQTALDSFFVRGLNHNIPFLAAIMGHHRFQAGRLSTGFIAEEFPQGFRAQPASPAILDRLVAIAATVQARAVAREGRISGRLDDRPVPAPTEWTVRIGSTTVQVAVRPLDGAVELHPEGGSPTLVETAWDPADAIFRGRIAGRMVVAQVERRQEAWRLVHAGADVLALVRSRRAAELAALMPEKVVRDSGRFLRSPMPGLIVAIHVGQGEQVQIGQALASVDAMKMENLLRSERDGKVARIAVKAGDSVMAEAVILEFE
ncbi:MAG: acetyl/propionyl/methylcrotonyl-CoA carboxylase subunit alpha [Alphaproteobacteria bacterium]|nr:acetyl/propionyl/methylcrotonyl-CoA carboxylase subunit alpha [Alphaproteobacteria bacterium]